MSNLNNKTGSKKVETFDLCGNDKNSKNKKLIDKNKALNEREKHPENFVFKNQKSLKGATTIDNSDGRKKKNIDDKKDRKDKKSEGNTYQEFIQKNKNYFEKF